MLTMDWARKVREAADHEVVFVLRQCMVASEYTIRHLRWDEIPQLDPRNLRSARLLGGNPDTESQGNKPNSDSVNTDNSRSKSGHKESALSTQLMYSLKGPLVGNLEQRNKGLKVLLETKEGESSTDPVISTPDAELPPQSLDDETVNTADIQHHHMCCESSDAHQLSQSYSCSAETSVRPDVTYSSSCPRDVFERSDFSVVHHEAGSGHSSSQDHLRYQVQQPPPCPLSQSLSEAGNDPKPSSASTFSGSSYYGTWHGSRKIHPPGKMGSCSRNREGNMAADPPVCCQHKHVASSRSSSRGVQNNGEFSCVLSP